MRIAVTYENGEVFGHFGRTQAFKLYDVQNGEIISSKVIGTDGQGHGALAGVLVANDVNLLICGGIGMGAQIALDDMGIELCAGAVGDADAAVHAYLAGELVNTGSNCDHHHHDGCGHHHHDGHCCH